MFVTGYNEWPVIIFVLLEGEMLWFSNRNVTAM